MATAASAAPASPARSAWRPTDAPLSTFAALGNARYRQLFVAGLFSFSAVQGQQVARGWLARELTGTNAGLGGVYLGFGIPMLIMTPLGGVFADRLPKRTVMLAAGTIMAASSAWIAVADALDLLEYWMLVGAAMLQATGISMFAPARVAFTAEVVDRPMLPNAIALTQMSVNAARIAAPAIAGALIAVPGVGTAGVYFGCAALLVIALVLMAGLPVLPVRDRVVQSVGAELVDGLRYVRHQRSLYLLLVVSLVVVMVGFPYMAFFPTMADETFDVGSGGFGLMSATAAVGALLVSVWVAGRSRIASLWTIQTAGGAVFAAGIVLLAAAPNFALALAAIALIGGASAAFQTSNNTLILTEASLEYHGRVQGLLMFGFSGFGLVALPLGVLADAIGLRETLGLMGAVSLVTMGVYALARRRLPQRPIQHVFD